jgi:ribosomal protein L37AE/L43A
MFFIPESVNARVGGGGGSSSSGGGGGDGIGELIFYIILLIPFPYNMIVVGIIIVLYIIFQKRLKQRSIFNQLPSTNNLPSGESKSIAEYKNINPSFNEEKFKEKIKIAFTAIQNAWAEKDISKVRRYISDGMYQRLNTQIKMMNLLEQRNEINKLTVKGIYLDKVQQEGNYDVIHVAIHASINDKFVSDKYSKLNSGGYEEFVEYWSFIKKHGIEEKDMFSNITCPNCGGELPKEAGEISKCEHCGTITNSGAYDWVLAEITQAYDYVTAKPLHDLSHNLNERVNALAHDNDDFAVQLIEDKVSNGYLQIETAKVFKKPDIMKRFVSDELFSKLSLNIESVSSFVYNRIYLNDVTLIGALQKNEKNVLAMHVKTTYQRVSINGGKLTILDPQVISKTEVVMVSRDIKAGENKGSLYARQCPSCGAPIGDSIDMNCAYCGALLNSTSNEWIITDIFSLNEYMEYFKANAQDFMAKLNPNKIDQMYKVRDYAFNNVLIMIAADGVFDLQEIEFANSLARKWGYNTNKVQGLIEMARNNQLVIQMPEDKKERVKIYKLMEKAANADNKIVDEEKQLLDFIRDKYL